MRCGAFVMCVRVCVCTVAKRVCRLGVGRDAARERRRDATGVCMCIGMLMCGWLLGTRVVGWFVGVVVVVVGGGRRRSGRTVELCGMCLLGGCLTANGQSVGGRVTAGLCKRLCARDVRGRSSDDDDDDATRTRDACHPSHERTKHDETYEAYTMLC